MKLTAFICAAVALCIPAPAITQATPITPERLKKLLPAVEPEQPDVVFQNYALVKRIECNEGSGTGFRVGAKAKHMLSVAHVTGLTNCGIDSLPISLTEQDEKHDFSRFDTGIEAPNGFAVDCGGFKPGRWYWAVGHALGKPFQTAVAVYATIYFGGDGKRIFIGKHTVVPGMSGGPIIDPDTGKVVGTVNAYVPNDTQSLSRELKDTSVCGGSIA